MANAVVIEDIDTVAVVIEPVKKGTQVEYRMPGGTNENVMAADDIPVYHKIAIKQMEQGDNVVKYGQHIGLAGRAIRAGEHVHVHNVEEHRENLDNTTALPHA